MVTLRGLILLTAVYLALTANLQPSNLVLGLLLAAGILFLLRPESRDQSWRFSLSGIMAMLRYILVLIYDLIVSGIEVARLVLNPDLPLQQGTIAIPTTCATEASQALSAHAITLTPGELVIEMDEAGTMYTHVLDTSHAEEDAIKAQEMREQMLGKIAL